jgi:hypothetical protein
VPLGRSRGRNTDPVLCFAYLKLLLISMLCCLSGTDSVPDQYHNLLLGSEPATSNFLN